MKIGCTTDVMQKYLKIPSPCLGRVMEKETFEGNSIVDYENYIRPGVECEIAVILSKILIISIKKMIIQT